MTSPPEPDPEKEQLHWAGHGHVGAFLMQVSILILVNLAVWGGVFLMALKFSGVIGGEDPGS